MAQSRTKDTSKREAEKLRRALGRRDLKAITPAAILAAFRADGIRSIEDYAKKLSDVIREQKGAPQRIDIDAIARPTPKTVVAAIRHQVPQVPFVMGGTVYDPKDIARFNGRELLFVDGEDELLVYSDTAALRRLLQAAALTDVLQTGLKKYGIDQKPGAVGPADADIVVGRPPHSQGYQPPPTNCVMFDDVDYSGSALYLDQGQAFPDLTENYTWPFGSGWNDCISSIYPTSGTCVFWEHINFQGSQLVTSGSDNLTKIGWNDRISSVANFKTVYTSTP
jgi:hypothetical protein